jgi:hypothetical protein
MGLVTETAEVVDLYKRKWAYKEEIDRVKMIAEVGDILWYIAFGFQLEGETLPDDLYGSLHENALPPLDQVLSKIVHFSSMVYCQSHSYLSIDENVSIIYDLRQLLQNLWYFCYLNNFDILEVAKANILKQRKRYPNGFNIEDALNRDEEHELSHIS